MIWRPIPLMLCVAFGGASAQAPAPNAAANNPRTAAGATLFMRALCTHAAADDHAWVAARVKLPLKGISAVNETDDAPLSTYEFDSAKSFKYIRFCRALPATGTALTQFKVDGTSSSGHLELGKVSHLVRFDLDPPRLIGLDAHIVPRPVPAPKTKVRDYQLEALPYGFTRKEPRSAKVLRRQVIKALKEDPRCIQEYVSSDTTSVRVEVRVDPAGNATVRPFQIVSHALLGCLSTQFAALKTLRPRGASTVFEVVIPVSASEFEGDEIIEAAK